LLTTPSFTIGGKQYIAALHPASAPGATVFAGRGGLIQGASFQTVKAGDVIVLYALGCGPTNPATQGGVVAAQNSAMTLPFQVRIGGTQAQVNFAGVIQGSIGLYQFNVVIPANFGSGDQSIELIVDGVSDGQSLFLSNQ
jgi:uncharacterized protein (TIGR03437 family)